VAGKKQLKCWFSCVALACTAVSKQTEWQFGSFLSLCTGHNISAGNQTCE